MAANWRARRARCRTGYQTQSISKAREEPAAIQLFNFQWLARSAARSLFLLFTYGSRRRLFINQSFFEQLSWGVPKTTLTIVGGRRHLRYRPMTNQFLCLIGEFHPGDRPEWRSMRLFSYLGSTRIFGRATCYAQNSWRHIAYILGR